MKNTQIVLRERPVGNIKPALDGTGTFEVKRGLNVSTEQLEKGQVVVAVTHLSLDPAMRGWLRDARSYLPPVKIGEVMRSGGVGQVIKSNDAAFKEGDWVSGTLGWQQYAQVPAKGLEKISVDSKTSPSLYLGVLGMPGQTAYWGFFDVCQPKKGDMVVVSGAAGAVGSVVCQLAKAHGCTVVAIAGGKEKCDWLKNDLGVDVALDYKSSTFRNDFKKAVGYLDVYFDNVGGEILDLALTRLKKNARIAICGAISDYNNEKPRGLQNYQTLIAMRAKIQGFIVFDYASRYAEAAKRMKQMIDQGQLKVRETVIEGLESCPEGLCGLFEGKNTGKLVVKLQGSADAKL